MAGNITKPKKPKSKRTPVRLRHKIQKASAEKQRKARKQAKKNPEWRSKLKKDPGIPNLFPYKEKILQEIEEGRRRKEEDVQRRRELAKAAKKNGDAGQSKKDEDEEDEIVEGEEVDMDEEDEDEDAMMGGDDDEVDDSNPMAALLASARRAAEQYDRELQSSNSDDMDEDGDNESLNMEDDEAQDGTLKPLNQTTSTRRAYDKIFKQVISQADVILYVLDARDPLGTRSREVEQTVMAAASGGKRLMLILNKIDLTPPSILRNWLIHLRRSFPTLPLRASGAAPNAKTFNHGSLTVQSTASDLFKALKSYAASRELKRAISVGVIGYPNVGKSSVINALMSRMGGRGTACPAGAEAGVTTSIRSVKIDSKLTLLDSPGVVYPNSSKQQGEMAAKKNAVESHAHLVLLNAVPPKQINDPLPAVNLLLKRLSSTPDLFNNLLDVYDLPPLLTSSANGDTSTDFLVQVARKRGRLGKGGVPNLTAAAMTVVTDWRDGRIQGWTTPPVLATAGTSPGEGGVGKNEKNGKNKGAKTAVVDGEATMLDQKEIVTEWAKEFCLEGLWGDGGEAVGDGDAMEQ